MTNPVMNLKRRERDLWHPKGWHQSWVLDRCYPGLYPCSGTFSSCLCCDSTENQATEGEQLWHPVEVHASRIRFQLGGCSRTEWNLHIQIYLTDTLGEWWPRCSLRPTQMTSLDFWNSIVFWESSRTPV